MLLETLKKYIVLFTMVIASGMQIGCSDNQDSAGEQGVTISGTINDNSSSALSKVSMKASAMAMTDYELFCVTFESQPYSASSQLSQEGRFSLTMPAGVPFGCFINHSTTGTPVTTIAIAGDSDSFGDNSTSALQFRRDVDFGNLTMDLARAQILIPRDTVADAIDSNPAERLDPLTLHEGTYEMNCLPSGNAVIDAECDDRIMDDIDGIDQVYFRIMQAERNGEEVYGLGVWKSQQSFNDCGAIDLLDTDILDIQADENLNFVEVASGAAYSVGASCPLRDVALPADHENLEYYYAAGELVADGQGWTMSGGDRRMANPGCEIEHRMSVHFTGTDSANVVGHFQSVERNIDLNNGLGDCSHLDDNEAPISFAVEFVKQ